MLLKSQALRKRLLFPALLCFLTVFSFAQTDSCGLRISLLTCAPGSELYSIFGHTAIRVQDEAAGTDLVFNYGTFEFSPDFNIKFIRGKLLYSLSVEPYNEFMYTYRYESRSVQEQLLQLDCSEKTGLYNALQVNAREENRYYKYDFLYDNCTSRAGDIIVAHTKNPVVFSPIFQESIPSFRDQIHHYLDLGHQDWSKLGIDILLGVKLDKIPTNRQSMFLPDHLLRGIENARLRGAPLAAAPQTILQMPSPLGDASFFTPFRVFLLILLVIAGLSFTRKKWAKVTLQVFDFLFFFILGLAGWLLLFMWFGTDHSACSNNFNLLWALPTHLIAAFFVHTSRNWKLRYFRIICWGSIVLMLAWFFLPQQLNPALVPLVLLIIFRSWSLSKTQSHATKYSA